MYADMPEKSIENIGLVCLMDWMVPYYNHLNPHDIWTGSSNHLDCSCVVKRYAPTLIRDLDAMFYICEQK